MPKDIEELCWAVLTVALVLFLIAMFRVFEDAVGYVRRILNREEDK